MPRRARIWLGTSLMSPPLNDRRPPCCRAAPISVALPEQVEATIVEADAVVKGQTASSSYKPALLDNGVRVMVPPHIGAGTRIIVDVYERTYVGKVG